MLDVQFIYRAEISAVWDDGKDRKKGCFYTITSFFFIAYSIHTLQSYYSLDLQRKKKFITYMGHPFFGHQIYNPFVHSKNYVRLYQTKNNSNKNNNIY